MPVIRRTPGALSPPGGESTLTVEIFTSPLFPLLPEVAISRHSVMEEGKEQSFSALPVLLLLPEPTQGYQLTFLGIAQYLASCALFETVGYCGQSGRCLGARALRYLYPGKDFWVVNDFFWEGPFPDEPLWNECLLDSSRRRRRHTITMEVSHFLYRFDALDKPGVDISKLNLLESGILPDELWFHLLYIERQLLSWQK